jgi:hypothetical protein
MFAVSFSLLPRHLAPLQPFPLHPASQVCEDCPNVKYVTEREQLTVSVEPGMPDGHTITFFEEGEPLIDGEGQVGGRLEGRQEGGLKGGQGGSDRAAGLRGTQVE